MNEGVFLTAKRKRSDRSDRWLSNWTRPNTNKHTVALWNMYTIEFLHVTACGLDITVQGHFLKCAPLQLSPPPRLISSIPKQKLLLWEKCSATHVSAEGQSWSQAAFSGHRHVCLQTTERFCVSMTLRCLSHSKYPVRHKVHTTYLNINTRVKVSTRTKERWGFTAPKGQHPSLPGSCAVVQVVFKYVSNA